ncbi:MAG: ABC transporter ATP-binding protein [Acidimicrobiales bacterium]
MSDSTVNTPSPGAGSSDPLLAVDDLQVEFRIEDGTVKAVNGLSYSVDQGETLAILGESGSGKSVGAQAVMGLIDSPPGYITGGSIRFRGTELLTLEEEDRRAIRGEKIAMIFQDALSSLNPVFSVGWQIGEMFRRHRGMSKKEAKAEAIKAMDRVKIPDAAQRVSAYPHEFSGGMRQRIMIAMALALDPDVLIADEPTTALDVTVQAQVMDLLKDLQAENGMGLILITHDLGVVADVADRLVVMYAGRGVEKGAMKDVFGHPLHPYTEGLMNSIPRSDVHVERLEPIQGNPPDLLRIPSGCAFRTRCKYVEDRCSQEVPELVESGVGADGTVRSTACIRWNEVFS